MNILNPIRGLLDRKRSIEDLDVDELRKEKIRLEQEERKIVREVEELEERKQELFQQGKDETSDRQRRILATKIKELDVQGKNLDKNLQFIARQLRIVNGFMQIKENQRLLEKAGVSSVISTVDLPTLQHFVEEASVEGAFQMDKFQEILQTLEDTDRVVGGFEPDEDIQGIMDAMEDAHLADLESQDELEGWEDKELEDILDEEEPESEW